MIREIHLSDIDESVADSEQWLRNVIREAGRFEEALDYFKSALKSKKKQNLAVIRKIQLMKCAT